MSHKHTIKIGTMFAGSALVIGGNQIYNKQYWKLPILYGTLGASIGFAIHQNSIYKPLKKEYLMPHSKKNSVLTLAGKSKR